MVTDVRLEPRHLRRSGAGLPDVVIVEVARGRGNQPAAVADLAFVEVGAAPVGSTQGDRMRGEHQAGFVTQFGGQCGDRVADRVGEHLDQQRMVEVLAQLDQLRCTRPGGRASACDVLLVLRAARVAAPRRGGEDRCAFDPVVAHLRDGVFDVGLPVAVAEVDRCLAAAACQLGLDLGDERTVDPVDRRDPAEMQVVLGHRLQPLPRDAAAASDVLQERHHLVGPLGTTEGQQQQRVELHGHNNWVLAPPSA